MKWKIVILVVVIAPLSATLPAAGQSYLPPDPAKTCTVSKSEVTSWFVNAKIKANGVVMPAASVKFPLNNTICDFYKWASQMFLWLNSPTGKGQWVFDSTTFFDVSPLVNGKRTLIPNTVPSNFALRQSKPEEIGETGQAGGNGVLISQKGSLVYYGIHVNDVYAAFLDGQKGGVLKTDAFPTTAADLAAVEAYAGTKFSDGIALTMELKTSWVDAATVKKARYITIKATVPKYDRTSSGKWTRNGTEPKELALVGMHIVGSAQGHPEMIWATYEHIDNTPDNAYAYTNSKGAIVNVPYNSKGEFLFMAKNGPLSGANAERANVDASGDIIAASGQTIGPSDTVRMNPWGDAAGQSSSIDNNTQLISINNDVVNVLAKGDLRKNYLLGGAIWTQHGKIPPAGTQKGSLALANSTMETYHQTINCFVCHSATTSIGVSHIFGDIQPTK